MIKQLIKAILIYTPGFTNACRFFTRNHVRVFMYHRFCTDMCSGDRRTKRHVLDKQLDYVRKHHSIHSCDEHAQAINGGQLLGYCPVIFTIDDGYDDVTSVAIPLFVEKQIPVTVFIATGFVNFDYWFWWDRLRFLLEESENVPSTLNLIGHFSVDTHSNAATAWERISNLLVTLRPSEIERILQDLSAQLNVQVPAEAPECYKAANWQSLRNCESRHIKFGPHSVNHPRLSVLTLEEAKIEIEDSVSHCQNQLEYPSNTFCFPFGLPPDYSPDLCNLISTLGFDVAYAAHDTADVQNRFSQPRYSASNDFVEFRWQLCGATHLFRAIKLFLLRPSQ